MAYGVGSGTGVSFLPSTLASQDYDPVFDTEMNAEFLWQVLPSFYRRLMENQDIHNVIRSGLMQVIAADMLHLWEIDYAKSLRDVPIRGQRKWVKYGFTREFDFLTDPELSIHGRPDQFIYDSDTDQIDVVSLNRGGVDRGFITLEGELTQDASLTWSYTLSVESGQINSAILVGYHNGAFPRNMVHTLVTGVVNDPSTADSPQPVIAHVGNAGDLAYRRSSTSLDLDTDYRFDATYTARTGVVTLSVVEVEAAKVSGTTGATAEDDDGDTYTSEFSDENVVFDDEDVVEGDILVLDDIEYEIIEVSGSTLIVDPGRLPPDASDLTYEIRGEDEVLTLSLDLPADASDPDFTVSQFGVSNLDIRTGATMLSGNFRRKKMVGAIKDWTFMDPTVEGSLLEVPRLQDTITDPEVFLFGGTDYEVVDTTFQFQEPPSSSMWAEYSAYDEGFIQDNFGVNVNLEGTSSGLYRSQVRGLYYAFYRGPTPNAIRTGVQVLLGLPISEEAGEVESINPSFSGDFGELVVAGRSYLYPLAVGTSLTVGDEVGIYEPLSEGVEIVDYLNSPEWFDEFGTFNELRKYHVFQVNLNIDAFDVEDLAFAAAFVDEIKPTWKDKVFLAFKELEDDVDLDDDLSFKAVFTFADVPCDAVLPRYDSADFEGYEADWRFDQGIVDWDETSAAMRQTATLLSGTADFVNGSTGVVGTSTAFLTDIGGPGSVTDKYIAVGLVTSGSDMETASGSNVVTDTVGTFANVVAGDTIDVSGEGTFEVQSVDSVTQLTLDGPMTSDATGVTWTNFGAHLIWGQVNSVTDDENLTLSTIFGGDDGTYAMSLLDNDYRQVYYDQFLEACPDEELTFTAILSSGYQETLLVANSPARLNWTEFSVAVNATDARFVIQLGNQTDSGTSGSTDSGDPITFTGDGGEAFLTSIPNSGAGTAPTLDTWIHFTGPDLVAKITEVTSDTELKFANEAELESLSGEAYEIYNNTAPVDKYISTPDGAWYLVTNIIDHENIQVGGGAHTDLTDVIGHVADEVLTGTAVFTNGSASVDGTGTLFTSELAPGDWVQVVPTQDYSNITSSTPVVEVFSVTADDGVGAITLSSSYSGDTTGSVKVIRRGDSSVLPLAVDLPNGSQNITDWFGTAGDSVSDTVVEPTP